MTQDYPKPIAPPPELVQQWMGLSPALAIAAAFQAGADQELEACCEWLDKGGWPGLSRQLCGARRPKPPSLKEQALKALKVLPTPDGQVTLDITDLNTIRRALEQLPNHE
jgi:hypothetical protein